jgi:exodeoxyribonuclease V gamma subunit
MMHVWYSNQLERLADRLIRNLSTSERSPAARLFEMPTIVVPNRNIETFLKYEIARGTGIAAGLNFKVPEEFLKSLLTRQDGEQIRKLVSRGALRAFFIEVLSQDSDSRQPLPDAARAYIDAAGDDRDARDLRRFQLGTRLAQLARQYGDYRPDWLRSWATGQTTLDGGPLAGMEQWQRDLWSHLVKHARAQAERGTDWILPFELFDSLEKTEFEPHNEVHLFGFSYVWHGLHELINYLTKGSHVSIYSLAPFVEFQEDLAGVDLKSRKGPRFARRGARALKTTESSDAHSPDDLAIVAQWGRPGKEYLGMLGEFPATEFHPEFVKSDQKTVLGRLHREILERSMENNGPIDPDDSLAILACSGIRREAEVVANMIWRLIRDDDARVGSAPDRLRFRDIAVLLADRANQAGYQAHFRSVFEELHGIPFNMIDLPLAGECQVIEAVLLLLALPTGDFTRPELLKVLTHPAVRARFPEVNTERWREWCLGLEIVHGADRLDHDGTYIDRELFHWEQGLRRLVLGTVMSGPQSGDDRTYQLGDLAYLPYEQPGDALADVGRLLVLVRSLVADARFARSAQLTMTQWSLFFVQMVNRYFAAGSDTEQRALSQCLEKIQGLRDLDVSGTKVGYRIASECLSENLEGLTGSRGHYLADGVVVSPVLEMRSLPFRVVFLCGLGEGRFPAADGPDPLDLTLARRRIGDISPRERDKYLFLETLVCAREHLYLSYVARDAQTGDTLDPSPLVHELMRHLHQGRSGKPSDTWVTHHPLRRFDDAYFLIEHARGRQVENLPNYSTAARNESQARRLRNSLRDHCELLPRLAPEALRRLDKRVVDVLGLCPLDTVGAQVEPAPKVAISLGDLLAFLKCPLQGWARVMLRLHEDEDEDETAREDEPFVMGRLGETKLLREVFFDAMSPDAPARAPADFERLYALHIESRLQRGLMPVGLFGEAERRRHLAFLDGWHKSAHQRDLLDRCKFRVYRFGHASEDERVEEIESPIILDVPLANGSQPVRVELFGRTDLVAKELPASLSPVVRDQVSDKDFLSSFLDAIVLRLLPAHSATDEYHAHVITGGDGGDPSKSHRVFKGITAVKGRQFLIDVLADLLGGPHAYLLPCEAVFDYLSQGRSIERIVEEMKENDRTSCSSRYGPVPNFKDYDAPQEDEARRMIERRFGLFLEAGGMDK